MSKESRTCKGCGAQKHIDEFAVAKIIDGVIYKRWVCVKCYSKQKRNEQRSHAEWFEGYKKTQKCVSCGNSDHRTLQFHHRDPADKVDEVCMLVARKNAKEKILAEVAKCDCLCANCHSILHYEERKSTRGGGSLPPVAS